MVRTIEVTAGDVTISAKVRTGKNQFARGEVERIRDALADRLQEAAAGLPYIGVARNRVIVK